MDIENLNIVLGADASALDRGLQLAASRLRGFSTEVASFAKNVGTGLKGFSDAAKTSGVQAADNFVAGFKTVNGKLDAAFKDIDKRKKELESSFSGFNRLGEGLKTVGESLTKYVTLPLAAVGGLSAKAAIDFESAFAGVIKTTNLTGLSAAEGTAELNRLSDGIRNLAKEIPATATELAKIAESAGQLGIKRENVLGFTRTIADLGVATNLTGEEAASTLAKFANITQLNQGQFSNLGSSIVALGNNFATTEKDIAEMALRLAGAGKLVGLTDAQILGFSASLSSVGINAEAGGTAFSTVLKKIQLAVVGGGDTLEKFAKVAGLSGKQFAETFKKDAAGAMNLFIQGLGNMDKASGEALTTLGQLDLADIRVSDSLLRLAGAHDLSARATDLASKAFKENTALTKEAEQRYATTASQITIAKNKLTDLGITIGNQLLPLIKGFSGMVGGMSDALNNMSPAAAKTVLVLGGIVAAIGPLALALGGIITSLAPGGLLITGLGAMGTALTAATGPIGITIAAVAALAAGLVYLSKANERAQESYTATASANASLVSTVNPLISRYEELAAKTTRTTEEQTELLEIVKKVEAAIPGTQQNIDSYGVAMEVNTDKVRNFIAAQRELEKAKAAAAIEGARATLNKYGAELTQLRTKIDEFNRTGNVTVTMKTFGGGEVARQVALTTDEVHEMQVAVAEANVKFLEQEALVQKLDAALGNLPRTFATIYQEQQNLEKALTTPFLKGIEAFNQFGAKLGGIKVPVTPVVEPVTLTKLKEQLKAAQDKLQTTDVTNTKSLNSTRAEIKRLEELIKMYEGTGSTAKKAATEIERAFEDISKKLTGVNTRVKLNITTDIGGAEEKIKILEEGIKRLTDVGVGANNKGLLGLEAQLEQARNKVENFRNSLKFQSAPLDLNFKVTAGELDAAVVTSVMNELQQKLAEAQQYFNLYGNTLDLVKDKNDAYSSAVSKLVAAHVDQLNPALLDAAEKAKQTNQAFAVGSTMQQYSDSLKDIANSATLFGSSFETIPAKLAATAEAIKNLRASGAPETSEQLKGLMDSFELLSKQDKIVNTFTDIGNALGSALGNMASGVISGKDLMKAAFGELLALFADFMKKKGKQLIAMGVANLFSPGGQAIGALQIAAGTGLLVAAGAATAYGGSLASGGGKSSAAASNPSNSTFQPSSNVKNDKTNINITVDFKPATAEVEGNKLRIINTVDSYRLRLMR